MKTTFTIAICLLFAGYVNSQTATSKDCSVLKNEKLKFKYLDIQDTSAYVVITGNEHMEYHNNGKYFIQSTIQWLNDCEYNMTMAKVTIPDFPFHPGDVMNVKIDRIEEDIVYYTVTVRGKTGKGKFKILEK